MGFGYGHGQTANRGGKRYANAHLVHVWAQQEESAGQNSRGSSWFSGEWLYSYATAIARIYTTESGARILLIRDESFSVATSQHMPSPQAFAGPSFRVPFIGSSEGRTRERFGIDWQTENARVFVQRWQATAAGLFKISAVGWQGDLEKRVSGYYWSGDSNDPAERPRDVVEAAERWKAQTVAGLMQYRTQCLEYCDAMGVAYPVEFASESEARALAVQQVAEAVARFRRILDDPKNAARREASRKRNAEKAERYAAGMFGKRREWLETPDAQLIESDTLKHYGGTPRAPSIPYWKHTGGLSKAQTRDAESLLRDLETKEGQGDAIRAKEARLEFAAQEARRERERAAFVKWQAGEIAHAPESFRRDVRGGAYLRRVTRDGRDLIQTSQGAEVLFSDAVRLFKFAKLIRERCYFPEMSESDVKQTLGWKRNGARLRVSHFELESVHVDGSCRVGCHFLAWEQIESAARACGVFDLPAEDTTRKGAES